GLLHRRLRRGDAPLARPPRGVRRVERAGRRAADAPDPVPRHRPPPAAGAAGAAAAGPRLVPPHPLRPHLPARRDGGRGAGGGLPRPRRPGLRPGPIGPPAGDPEAGLAEPPEAPPVRVRTLLRYLTGDRRAILALAADRRGPGSC